jgi:protein-disulfide isomerase
MAQRKPKAANPPRARAAAGKAETPPAPGTGVFIGGALLLLFCAVMSLLLTAEHIGDLALPGCGAGGPCEEAANSIWGKVPLIQWPVAFLGLAYFGAMLAAWIISRGALPGLLCWVGRLGILGSVFFCVIIVVEWLFCPYCVAAHVGNLGFWITLELARSSTSRTVAALTGFAVTFAGLTGGTGAWHAVEQQRREERGEAERKLALQEMIERSRDPKETPLVDPPTVDSPTADPPAADPRQGEPADPAENASPAQEPPAAAEQPPFTGRYRLGPEKAPIRIVMITDYQCRDCRRQEQIVMQLVESRDDLSLSVKHFPFNSQCNPYVPGRMHPNACWAARAAEAAGILYGNDGFWKMHKWLFARGGGFTGEELQRGLLELGFDPPRFYPVLQSEETLERVRADTREARSLGLHFTPMIFINGVELKGWYVRDAVRRTIEELAATNPPPRTAAADHPPPATQKLIEDWVDQPIRPLPPDANAWHLGATRPAIDIVLWGDFQEEGCAKADAIIRDFVTGRADARYTFRHYPFNSACNPNLPYERHVMACWAARVAEAAGVVGGADIYWATHAWLMENHDLPLRQASAALGVDPDALGKALFTMSEDDRQKKCAALGVDSARAIQLMQQAANDALADAAAEMGLDIEKLRAEMVNPQLDQAISEDIQAARRLPVLRYGRRPGLYGIPTIFINGKYVLRWRLEDRVLLEDILRRAAEEN